jgi:hypothetical protein
MKKTTQWILAMVVMVGGLVNIAAAFSGAGAGTAGDPYQITTCAEFIEINDENDAHYALMNNLDCTAEANSIMVDQFEGSFDGNNNTIIVDIYDDVTSNGVGLFRSVWYGTIENLHVEGSVVGKKFEVGWLAGMLLYGATVSGSSANVDVSIASTADYGCSVGGLIGMISVNATVINSSAHGNVSAYHCAGGLVGTMYYGSSIINSYAAGDVFVDINEAWGLVATAVWDEGYEVFITNSYALGTVNGNKWVGGLVGYSEYSVIENSYAMGTVSGNERIGGLIGEVYASDVSNSFAAGLVTGSIYVGGLIGFDEFNTATITNSFRDLLAGANVTTSDGGIGADTADMQDITLFATAGRDIQTSSTDLNNNYPYLAWQAGDASPTWYIYAVTPPIAPMVIDWSQAWSNNLVFVSGIINTLMAMDAEELAVNIGHINNVTRFYNAVTRSGSLTKSFHTLYNTFISYVSLQLGR